MMPRSLTGDLKKKEPRVGQAESFGENPKRTSDTGVKVLVVNEKATSTIAALKIR